MRYCFCVCLCRPIYYTYLQALSVDILKRRLFKKFQYKAILQIPLAHNRYIKETSGTSYISIQRVAPPPRIVKAKTYPGGWGRRQWDVCRHGLKG